MLGRIEQGMRLMLKHVEAKDKAHKKICGFADMAAMRAQMRAKRVVALAHTSARRDHEN